MGQIVKIQYRIAKYFCISADYTSYRAAYYTATICSVSSSFLFLLNHNPLYCHLLPTLNHLLKVFILLASLVVNDLSCEVCETVWLVQTKSGCFCSK